MLHTRNALAGLGFALAASLCLGCAGAARTDAVVAEAPPPPTGLARIHTPEMAEVVLADAPLWILIDVPHMRAVFDALGIDEAIEADEPELAPLLDVLLPPPLGQSLEALHLPDDAIVVASLYPTTVSPWLTQIRAALTGARDTSLAPARRVAHLESLDDVPAGLLAGVRLWTDTLDPGAMSSELAAWSSLTLDDLELDGTVFTVQDGRMVFLAWTRPTHGGLLIDLVVVARESAAEDMLLREELGELVRQLDRDVWRTLRAGLPELARPAGATALHVAVAHDFIEDGVLAAAIAMLPDSVNLEHHLGNFESIAALAAGPPGHPPAQVVMSVERVPPDVLHAELTTRFETRDDALAEGLAVPFPDLPVHAAAVVIAASGHLGGALSAATDGFVSAAPLVNLASGGEPWLAAAMLTLPWSLLTVSVSTASMWRVVLPASADLPVSGTIVQPVGAVGGDTFLGLFVGADRDAIAAWTSCLVSSFEAPCHTLTMPTSSGTNTAIRDGQTTHYTTRSEPNGYVGLVAPTSERLEWLGALTRRLRARVLLLCASSAGANALTMPEGSAVQLAFDVTSEGMRWTLDLVLDRTGSRPPLCPFAERGGP